MNTPTFILKAICLGLMVSIIELMARMAAHTVDINSWYVLPMSAALIILIPILLLGEIKSPSAESEIIDDIFLDQD